VDEASRKARSCEDQVAAANRRLCCPISGAVLKCPVTAVDGKSVVARQCGMSQRGLRLTCREHGGLCRAHIRERKHRGVVQAV
jgi:hypothetical protein